MRKLRVIFQIYLNHKLRGKLRVLTVTLPELRTLCA